MMFLRFQALKAGKRCIRISTSFPKKTLRGQHFESSQIWYYDGLHYPEPHFPFDLIWDEAWSLALSQYNTRHWLIPPGHGY